MPAHRRFLKMVTRDHKNNRNRIVFPCQELPELTLAAHGGGESWAEPAAIAPRSRRQAPMERGGRCGCSGKNRLETREMEGSKTGKSAVAGVAGMIGIPGRS